MTMYATHLRIDTAVPPAAGPSSGSLKQIPSASSATSLGVSPQIHLSRLRSASNASSASSLSVISPAASSTNTSATSLLITGSSSSRVPSPVSADDTDETMGSMPEYVLAMHDYEPQHNNSTCLSFHAGQVIHVLNRDPSGWWDGELGGKRGWFPSNYVNADVNPLVEGEDVTETDIIRKRTHTYSQSTVSERSYPKSHSPRHTRLPSAGSDLGSYVPPLMVPLLHGLSLLQGAVRAGRISHFQPSTACIISCVRSVLNATDTLLRDAPILQRFPALAHERRIILSTLASLVAQAKRASEDSLNEDSLEFEVEAMLRLAQQVFAVVRKFLAVAVQCGIELPERRDMSESINGTTFISEGSSSWSSTDDPNDRTIEVPLPSAPATIGRTPTKSQVKGRPSTPRTISRTRSLGDLRSRALSANKTADDIPAVPPLFDRSLGPLREKALKNHKPGAKSVSSTASSSSFSSLDSSAQPTPPSFPHGPCTMVQVMDALRSTHDHYLSAVAAFVGHAHSHSRTSHPSSTGHMYDLVREIVEMSCKLLTIVEAVLQHPDVPNSRLEGLKVAKEALYNVTSELAESVRLLTTPIPSSRSEEQEKQMLLRSATAALKTGSDLASAVKLCLNRSLGERPFIINLPQLGEPGSAEAFRAASYSSSSLIKSTSMSALHETQLDGADEEDLTIQAPNITVVKLSTEHSSSSESGGSIAKSLSSRSGDTDVTLPDDVKVPTPLVISRTVVEPDLSSPTSYARTDDGTTWEGSTRNFPVVSLEDKIINGDLPSLPPEPLAPIPESVGDPAGYMLSHDYAIDEIAYNSEGVLVGATLPVLVERLTPHDSIVDPAFSAVFFMTFRLFCTPTELVDTLIARYNLVPPPGLSTEDIFLWQQRKGIAVRLRVSNVIKFWLEAYWRSSTDDVTLPQLEKFARDGLATMFSTTAERILDLIQGRKERRDMGLSPKGDRTRDPGMSLNPPTVMALTSEIPRPTMTKALLAALRSKNFQSISITDFDALELARQLTVMECTLYCAITPEEILESGQEGVKSSLVNVKAVSSLSTVITGWVAESILNEPDTKKRTALVKFFIKVADRCVALRNYSTFRSILAALDSSTIARLQQTWTALPQKSKLQLESLRRLADHGRNYREYRSKLRNTAPPAVPFLGLYLTDVTFCREGNPSHRASPLSADKKLLNFNKYHKLARIVQDMQRFQVPYNLKAIPEVQEYLNHVFQDSRKKGDLQDLYRRSLLVEPRQPADSPPTDMRPLFNWASRSQPQVQLVPPT